MNRLELQIKILTVAARLVLLPPLLLLLLLGTLLDFIKSPAPGANILAIIIVLSVLGILHLVIRIGYLKNIRAIKQGRSVDRGLNVGLGILLLMSCLFILDGAVEALEEQNLYTSILMFTAAFIDFVTGLASIGTLFLKSKKGNQANSK